MERQIHGPETGGATPRSAHPGNTPAVAIGLLVLLFVSPVGFVVAIAAVFGVVGQVRRHWWEPAIVSAAVLLVVGIAVQALSGALLAFHFGGYIEALLSSGSWLAAVARTTPIGVPLGAVVGCLYVGASEAWTGGAEWHPMEQRRRAVVTAKSDLKVTALLGNADEARLCSAPPLGVTLGGDLSAWVEGRYVVVPTGQFPAMGLLGESGSGKTVTAERLVSVWATAGRKVIFADFKGSDPELAERVVAAYKSVRPEAGAAFWPAQPLDMWRGSPVEVANRLLQVQDFTEPYYKAVAETAVRLAVLAPDIDARGPVSDSAAFLERLNGEFLKRAYEGTPEARDVASVVRTPNALDGVRLRYAGFFSALNGRLDHGFSFEDVDVAVLTVPTLAQPSDAMAVARMVLTDFAAYCLRRKPRIGEDVTLLVDEFSAITSAAPMMTDLAERVRDVGGQVVVSAQSYEGLGRDDAERRRMIGALSPGGILVHRLSDPDEVLRVAGTVRATELSHQLDAAGQTGLGTVKMAHKMRVDPDAVRQAKTGEAWIITQGRAAHVSILRSRITEATRHRAERLVAYAWVQAREALAAGAMPEAEPWWEVPIVLGPPQRQSLEVPPSLAELTAGPDAPVELPAPPRLIEPDPRLILAIAAYVRAQLFGEARRIAAQTPGLHAPDEYVDRLTGEREAAVAAARSAVSWRKRRRGA